MTIEKTESVIPPTVAPRERVKKVRSPFEPSHGLCKKRDMLCGLIATVSDRAWMNTRKLTPAVAALLEDHGGMVGAKKNIFSIGRSIGAFAKYHPELIRTRMHRGGEKERQLTAAGVQVGNRWLRAQGRSPIVSKNTKTIAETAILPRTIIGKDAALFHLARKLGITEYELETAISIVELEEKLPARIRADVLALARIVCGKK